MQSKTITINNHWFTIFPETFDQILFNPPYIPDSLSRLGWLDKAWNGGPSGRTWINPFLRQVSRYLRKGGILLLIQSSLSGYEETLKTLKRENYCVHILAKHKLFFELAKYQGKLIL